MTTYVAFNHSIHLASFLEQVDGFEGEWRIIAARNWCYDHSVDYNTIPNNLL